MNDGGADSVEKFIQHHHKQEKSLASFAYAIPIDYRLTLTKSANDADITLGTGTTGKAALMITRAKDPSLTHPYRFNEVHARASQLNHADISLAEIQDRRDTKLVPQGKKLHEYANVYFHARNPMMSKRRNEAENLCILRVSREILNIPKVVVTNQNAASDYVRFLAPFQMSPLTLDLDMIYAQDWRHDDQIAYWRHKSRKCAEVLVPDIIPIEYIFGIYVFSQASETLVRQIGCNLPIVINSDLFFR